jgi:hypothetical protein
MSRMEQIYGRMLAQHIRMRMKDLTSKQLFSVPCPRCGAATGHICELHSGGFRFEPHLDRKLSAVETVERKRMHVDAKLQESRSKFRFATPCYSLKRTSLLSIILGVTFGLSLIGAPRLAAEDNCQPTYDAMSKVMTTPTHIYVTMTAVPNNGDKPITAETIYAAGSAYVKVNGKWTRGGMTLQEVMKKEEENRKNSKTTCRYLKDESVNGETAAVYNTHSETGDIKSDGQIWISKSKGLPLRQEFDIDSGGPGGKNHQSVRYEYTNIQPPPLG